MTRELEAAFTAAVVSMTLDVGGHPITMVGSGDEWSGHEDVDLPGGDISLTLEFRAPSYTKFALSLTVDGNELYEESGHSDYITYRVEGSFTLP